MIREFLRIHLGPLALLVITAGAVVYVATAQPVRAGGSLSDLGIIVIVDPATGCEYLTTKHAASPLTLRMRPNGTQVCRAQ